MEDFCIEISEITHNEDENWFDDSDSFSKPGAEEIWMIL